MDKSRLTKKDMFHNRCKFCNKCCRKGDSLVLSPIDLYRVAKHTGQSISDFIDNNCIIGNYSNSKVPLVALEFVDEYCIYRGSNGECGLGDAKPYQCDTHPLIKELESSTNEFIYETSYKTRCTTKDPKITSIEVVEDYLARVDETLERASDEWFLAYNELSNPNGSRLIDFFNNLHFKIQDELYKTLTYILYESISSIQDTSLEEFLTRLSEQYQIAKLAILEADRVNSHYLELKEKSTPLLATKRKLKKIDTHIENTFLKEALDSYKEKYKINDLEEIKSTDIEFLTSIHKKIIRKPLFFKGI